jgi:AraC-like DNA-binding protein
MSHHFSRYRFSDFGQLHSQLRCWKMDAIQLLPGVPALAFDCFDSSDMLLWCLKCEQGTSITSVANSGWYSLVVHISAARWCGIDLPAGAFVAIQPGYEARAVSRLPWEAIGVVVHQDMLASWGAPLAEVTNGDGGTPYSIFPTDPQAVQRYHDWTRHLFQASASEPDPEYDPPGEAIWTSAIRDTLRNHLVDMLRQSPGSDPVSQVRRVARYDLVLAAMRLIQQEGERRVTVAELSRTLGVTARALQYAFHGILGISPSQYILAERLNRVRRQLMGGSREASSVTTVALDHQFENLGRFSKQYARLFGERPSEALRTARIAVSHG